ncbi:unnamed protein product [Amoebophrya sp. A120]|nr:unnamed protein product [Amoebophrya sp. A120]|eukprot:GSA120T00005149001.1
MPPLVVKKQKETLNRAETEVLEQESAHMEKKLALLRDMIQLEEEQHAQKKDKNAGTNWKSASVARPLRRGYIDEVSAARKKGISTRSGTGKASALSSGSSAGTSSSSSSGGAAAGNNNKDVGKPDANAMNPIQSLVAELYTSQTTTTKQHFSPRRPQGSAGSNPDVGRKSQPGAGKGSEGPPPDDFAQQSGSSATALASANNLASTNLTAALQKQKAEQKEVQSLLQELGLQKYSDKFEEEGFDSKDVVLEMEEEHMQQLGMAMGHRIKLRKWIAVQRGEVTSPAMASKSKNKVVLNAGPPEVHVIVREGDVRGSSSSTHDPSINPASKNANNQAGAGSGILKKSLPARLREEVERNKGTTLVGQQVGGSLLDGEYDEAAQAASFRDAVMAWRKQGTEDGAAKPAEAGESTRSVVAKAQNYSTSSAATTTTKQEDDILFTNVEAATELGKKAGDAETTKGLASFGSATLQFPVGASALLTGINAAASSSSSAATTASAGTGTEGSAQTEPQQDPLKPEEGTGVRKCCYSCYKQFYDGQGRAISEGKDVCSAECEALERQKEARRKEIAERRRKQMEDIAAQQDAREAEKQRLLNASRPTSAVVASAEQISAVPSTHQPKEPNDSTPGDLSKNDSLRSRLVPGHMGSISETSGEKSQHAATTDSASLQPAPTADSSSTAAEVVPAEVMLSNVAGSSSSTSDADAQEDQGIEIQQDQPAPVPPSSENAGLPTTSDAEIYTGLDPVNILNQNLVIPTSDEEEHAVPGFGFESLQAGLDAASMLYDK